MAENPRTTPGVNAAMTIAGSDSSGGAGIQADLKTFTAMKVFGTSAITAITAQNTTGVKKSQPLDPSLVEAQIDAVANDIRIVGTKTGMLATKAIIQTVVKAVKSNSLQPLVVDPVMVAKGGDSLIDDDAVKVLCGSLLPLAAVTTPNGHEAARMLGQAKPIKDIGSAQTAAKQICKKFGVRTCVVTGIHRETSDGSEDEAVDIYFDGSETHELVGEWMQTENTHGSGCVFSAAIAAALASGEPIDDAVHTAKAVVAEAIRQTTDLGAGHCPVNVMAYIDVKK